VDETAAVAGGLAVAVDAAVAVMDEAVAEMGVVVMVARVAVALPEP
jgi:hypothetical protein